MLIEQIANVFGMEGRISIGKEVSILCPTNLDHFEKALTVLAMYEHYMENVELCLCSDDNACSLFLPMGQPVAVIALRLGVALGSSTPKVLLPCLVPRLCFDCFSIPLNAAADTNGKLAHPFACIVFLVPPCGCAVFCCLPHGCMCGVCAWCTASHYPAPRCEFEPKLSKLWVGSATTSALPCSL